MKRTKLVLLALVATSIVAVALLAVQGLLAQEEDNPYVGAKECRTCHIKEFKSWQKTKHASVFDELSDEDKKKPEALKIRTTGYGKPGGFKSIDETAQLANVGCEACHGPAGKHAAIPLSDKEALKATAKASEAKAVCVECHTPHDKKKKKESPS
jgi:cytochrome c553